MQLVVASQPDHGDEKDEEEFLYSFGITDVLEKKEALQRGDKVVSHPLQNIIHCMFTEVFRQNLHVTITGWKTLVYGITDGIMLMVWPFKGGKVPQLLL